MLPTLIRLPCNLNPERGSFSGMEGLNDYSLLLKESMGLIGVEQGRDRNSSDEMSVNTLKV